MVPLIFGNSHVGLAGMLFVGRFRDGAEAYTHLEALLT